MTLQAAHRPQMAQGYGISSSANGLLTWDWVDSRMAASRNYWISTTRPDSRPHVVPVWGVWLDGVLYFGGDRQARRSRNLAVNPQASVHLESGDEVVIIEGRVEEVEHDLELLTRIAEAMAVKYPPFKPDPEPAPGTAMYRVRAQTVFAWTEQDYPNTATRWKFDQ
jgi:nitroimidazol reductase NimA-like FMN-containing flavoprotein (pyridoxamine 5'-phosphate oxidase superfamily)